MEQAAKALGKLFNDKNDVNNESWLVTKLRWILASTEKAPARHKFRFENTRNAAKSNTKIIKKFKYDFVKACQHQRKSIANPGTEFRSIHNLSQLFQHHEDWSELKSIIEKGCDYKLDEIVNEKTRKEDLLHMINRGNHKSTKKQGCDKILQKTFTKEVEKGWIVPVTLESTQKIKDLFVIPLGIAHQLTINENGQRIPKQRVTHDASFPTPSGDSVNNRTIEELLLPCIYGQCLRRILHGILQIRFNNPKQKIYMSKYDLDAAYRRLHVLPSQNLQCVTIIDRIAYIPLRLPFGVASGPSLYSTMSETIFDLTNDLLLDETWNLKTLHSPIEKDLEPPQSLPETIPFAEAKPLHVHVPSRDSFCDGYIDDFLAVGLDSEDTVIKSQQAPTIAVHSIFRPIADDEPIPRDEPISVKKLKGEGIPSEQKVMLGWLLCTRTCRIYLPVDKQKAWNNDIVNMLKDGTTNAKQLESMIGRFNHVGFIIPTARYFINRLRHLLFRCEKYGKQTIKKWESDDLKLWQYFLQKSATNGISFNNICFTKYNIHTLTDASEYGLGGFNVNTGLAWRYQLPQWMQQSMHINLLEFIACTIGIWVELLQDNGETAFKRIHALTDNSSAVGWLYKASFNPLTHLQHDVVARKLAKILLDNDASITSQHTPGKYNIIADSLSRDFHLPPNHLTFILKSLFPLQTPENFRISPLPKEITCWLSSLKASSTKPRESQARPERSKTGAFFAGTNSWQAVVSKVNTLKASLKSKEQKYSGHLQKVLDEMKMDGQAKEYSQEAQFPPPSATYVRPFGRIHGATRL